MSSNNNEVLVSIIIPIYNVEKYIKKCIDSVINQTWRNLEIICVNDGTKDNSMEIVGRKATEDSRIIIVNIENSGLSVARNTGIEKATGKYIYFLDSDDWLAEDAIETLVNCAEENSLDVLQFNAECIFESDEIAQRQSGYAKYYVRKGQYPGVYDGEEFFIRMVQNGDFKPSACLIFTNRNFLESIMLRFYPGILHEDNLFTICLLQRAGRMMFIDVPLYKRLVREASITSGEKGVKHAYGFYICHRECVRALSKCRYSEAYFSTLEKYLELMKKNVYLNIKNLDHEFIKAEIRKIAPKEEGLFLDYIYCVRKVSTVAQNRQSSHSTGKENIIIRLLKKIKRNCLRVKNRIIRMIPAPVRWTFRTLKNLGPGYFVYRKELKRHPNRVCVSIIIPVFNVEKYLTQALDSLTNQTLRNIEIICVDDGSTDKSLEILHEYQKKDKRFKILTQEKQGAGAARNLGLDRAVGEYILFLDSDDIFDLNLCNEVYFQCIRKKADLCLYGAKRLNMQTFQTEPMGWVLRADKVPRSNLFSGKEVGEFLFQMTSGCPWSKMYRREFIINNGLKFQNLQNTNDAYFVRMSIALAERITTLKRCFVTYRYNEGNNIQSNKSKKPLEFYKAFKEIKLELQRRGIFEAFERTYCNMVMQESLFNLKTAGNEEAQEQIRELLKNEAVDFYELKKHPEEYYYANKDYLEIKQFF